MPGFDGLEEAAATLRRIRDEQIAAERKLEREERWKRGGATLNEMEEFYQEQRGKFSEAYFSGSPFYVGDSFKDWYLSSGRARPDMGGAMVYGAFLLALMGQKERKK